MTEALRLFDALEHSESSVDPRVVLFAPTDSQRDLSDTYGITISLSEENATERKIE